MSNLTDSIEHNLRGAHFFSVGACPGCDECGLTNFIDTDAEGYESACEIAEEGGFSWSSCDSCGSKLGGSRYPAHGIIADSQEAARGGEISHFEVCADCLVFHANGDEPENV